MRPRLATGLPFSQRTRMRPRALLVPGADESPMNFEGVGVVFRQIYCFPQHFCTLGANFAENVAALYSRPNKLQQAGPEGVP